MAKRMLVIGNANIEYRVSTPYIPAPYEVLRSDGKCIMMPGGDAATAALALTRLSLAEAILCARIGDDFYGDRLTKVYAELGINIKPLAVDKTDPTGFSVVLLEDNGVKRTVLFEGANKNLWENDVSRGFSCFPDSLLLMLSSGENAAAEATKLALRDNLPVFVDCSGIYDDFPLEKLSGVTCISPNEYETELLTGIRPNSIENCLKASIAISNRIKNDFTVLKLGERGCFVYDGKFCDLVSAYDTECIDKAGAGAAFTAALAGEYLRSKDILKAARYANAVASLVVSKNGLFSSIPTADAVDAILKS